jgi:hypothetical protein
MLRRTYIYSARRALSTQATAAPTAAKTATVASGGSTFGQRLNAFLVGAGLGFGSCFFFIEQELQDSNVKFEAYIKKLEGRISALEKKK